MGMLHARLPVPLWDSNPRLAERIGGGSPVRATGGPRRGGDEKLATYSWPESRQILHRVRSNGIDLFLDREPLVELIEFFFP